MSQLGSCDLTPIGQSVLSPKLSVSSLHLISPPPQVYTSWPLATPLSALSVSLSSKVEGKELAQPQPTIAELTPSSLQLFNGSLSKAGAALGLQWI